MEHLYTYYIQVLFLALLIVNHLFEIYLSRRQLMTLHKSMAQVPDEFKQSISLSDHQKSIQYASAKLRLNQFHLVWNCMLFFYWFPLKGIEKLYLALPFSDVHHEVLFLLVFFMIQFILNLPWSIYSTFSIEQDFGFNRTTPQLFVTDLIKGLILGSILGVPLIYFILILFSYFTTWWWLLSFSVFMLFQVGILWIYPTWIAPLFNKFTPLDNNDLKKGIENLAHRAGFNASEIFVMDASKRSAHGNAYFTGFGKNKRIVFFDTLLKQLENNEILAILAHEIGHMKLKHIPKSIITSFVFSFLSFFLMGKLANENWFYSGHFVRIIAPGVLILLFTNALSTYTFWLTPISSWISRKREFEADAYAAEETNSEFLISGLLKLYQQNASPVVCDPIYSHFYHSHPPASQRIHKLHSLVKRQTSE